MHHYRFKATTLGAYFDEDTVYDSEEIEFDLFEITRNEGEIFFVRIVDGGREYEAACTKESLELISAS